MKYMLKEIPIDERPRERLLKYGSSSLANYELLAIIIRTGSYKKSVLDISKEVLIKFDSLEQINEATVVELMQISGIGKAKAISLLAAIELGKRINIPMNCNIKIKSPFDSYTYLKDNLQYLNQENLVALYLNSKSEVIAKRTVTIGSLNQTLFNIKDILKWALKYSAAGIIIAHNHPSGDPNPSKQDIEATHALIQAAKLMEIIIVDHIIIGKNKYCSFKEKHIIE
ncbi:MAG: DNA repair protein RadC [Bacilli bacterium]|nr:DNA repair protein RadC [Bacilli bacterium]MDD2681499.1 DNA repair protein RadC [Bacilli bacterium]MDD3121579.1 DNA repair protein RadC [Bacilli bacterium]MDD4062938.1 DNA repair protein RadC [Bacilli bacterium]MDD4482296.1 DNA repair protein RadC [Bacilli bacterium]